MRAPSKVDLRRKGSDIDVEVVGRIIRGKPHAEWVAITFGNVSKCRVFLRPAQALAMLERLNGFREDIHAGRIR